MGGPGLYKEQAMRNESVSGNLPRHMSSCLQVPECLVCALVLSSFDDEK